MSKSKRLIFWAVFWFIGLFIFGWEIMALMSGEGSMPTWSRMVWLISEFIWPTFAYISMIIPVVIVLFGLWVAVHFAIGGPWRDTLFKSRRGDD